MISVIHQPGTSFKGLMAYLLHDKGASTSERVSWTHTTNLATQNPEAAWKVQAATAMRQAELKQAAGVANTGRKSKKSVMHYTLSWHPDERAELTKEEMLSAVLGSMNHLGTAEGERLGKNKKAKRTQFADEHQAIVVCHDEGEDAPLHVHVCLNRVHPQHGVMLPDSKDYERLSKWALEYRQAQGKEHLCPERAKNAAKKAQGLATSHRRKNRTTYEQEQDAENAAPGSRKKALLAEQKRRAKELKAKADHQRKTHAAGLRAIEDEHVAQEKASKRTSDERTREATARIRAEHAPKIDELTERQRGEVAAFEDAKGTAAGHVRNAWAALKTKQWMIEIRTKKLHAVTSAFKLALSSGLAAARHRRPSRTRDGLADGRSPAGGAAGRPERTRRPRGPERRAAEEVRA